MARDVLAVLWFFVPAFLGNMAPVFVQGHFAWLARPLDAGRCWRGRRLLGDHKTWRGVVAGVVAAVVTFTLQRAVHRAGMLESLALIDYGTASLLPGVLLGLGALVGDALKSVVKRQLDIAPGASWLVADQLDFYLGAYLFALPIAAVPLVPALLAAPIVFVGAILTTASGYGLGLKESWI